MNAPANIGYVPEIEQEVLGTLLSGANFALAQNVLETRFFVAEAHRLIYDACATAYQASGSCKITVVSRHIDKDALGKLVHPQSGGEYLATLVANVTFGKPRLLESSKKVVEQWARLTLAEHFSVLSEASNDISADVKQVTSRAGEAIDEVSSYLRSGPNRKTRFNVFEAAQNSLQSAQEARERGNDLTGITWGLADVNSHTGGIQRRDLTLMAARPSMGKTTVAMSCAVQAAMRGYGIGFISLEMDAEKVAARIVSDIAYEGGKKIPYANIIRGKIDKGQDIPLQLAADRLKDIPLFIEDQSGLTMSAIRFKAESLIEQAARAECELDCLIVDHIGLIKPSSRYNGNRVNEMAEISAGLKELARELDVAVLALSQLSRAVEQRNDKRPMLSDLRDSGALEQDADTIIFLYREAYYLERQKGEMDEAERLDKLTQCQNELEFIIAKQRNGPVTTVKLFADMAYSAVRNAA